MPARSGAEFIAKPLTPAREEIQAVGFDRLALIKPVDGGTGRSIGGSRGHAHPLALDGKKIKGFPGVNVPVKKKTSLDGVRFPAIRPQGMEKDLIARPETPIPAVIDPDGVFYEIIGAWLSVVFGEHRTAIPKNADGCGRNRESDPHLRQQISIYSVDACGRHGQLVPVAGGQHGTAGIHALGR